MIRSFVNETWKEFEPENPLKFRYAVSNYGRIVSFTNDINDGKILKCSQVGGYRAFRYKFFHKKKILNRHFYIHRLVAAFFLPDPEDKDFVIHLDHNKGNNIVSNLKWANQEEMVEHNKKSPAVIEAKKVSNKRGKGNKLTEAKVQLIKKKLLDPNRKTRMKVIAQQFGISEMQLYRIKTGENWGHVVVNEKGQLQS